MFFGKRHTTYPLLPFSQLVYDMARLMPSAYTFTQEFVIHGGASRKEHIEQALRTAIGNHPVFQSAVNWRLRQYKTELKDILHGKYHNIDLQAKDSDLYIMCSINRILGDGKSIRVLVEDICRAYEGKPLEPDRYWDYVRKWNMSRQSIHYNDSKAWLESEFADTSVPVRPNIDRRRLFTILPPKAGVFTIDLTDIRQDILLLTQTQYLSLDGFFSLCTALAIMDYCNTDAAALTWAYEGRETPDEQRIIGSLHRDVPFVIRAKTDITSRESREDLIRQARNQIRSGIAHSNYPYTLTKPHTQRWNYAVNVIRQTSPKTLLTDIPYKVEMLPAKPQKTAYALLDVEYYDEDCLKLVLRYSATHYKPSSMQRFAELIRKYAEWLVQKAEYSEVVSELKNTFDKDEDLKNKMQRQLAANLSDNPDPQTNPVRTLEDLYPWFDRYLTSMPWMGLEQKAGRAIHGLFHRIDQSIGYAYYLFGDLQFEPPVAGWLKRYNHQWAEYLDSADSWNNDYYLLAKADPLFELDGDKYESPDNWHTWNDFFGRRLKQPQAAPVFVAEGQTFPWLEISNNTLDIKTARIDNVTDLLGDSPYKKNFENCRFTHISLDVHNYHRFHSPVDGTIVDIQEIDGQLTSGGKIIWDRELQKYRYEQQDNIGFQMIEKRVAIVIDCKGEMNLPIAEKQSTLLRQSGLIAIIPVAVAQVGSIQLSKDIKTGCEIRRGQELGCFLFGGSDVVILTNLAI